MKFIYKVISQSHKFAKIPNRHVNVGEKMTGLVKRMLAMDSSCSLKKPEENTHIAINCGDPI